MICNSAFIAHQFKCKSIILYGQKYLLWEQSTTAADNLLCLTLVVLYVSEEIKFQFSIT